jgi:hypothetical protein
VATAKGVGLGVLVEQPDWGSLWSWLDGVKRDDVRRLANWLRSIADTAPTSSRRSTRVSMTASKNLRSRSSTRDERAYA